MLYLVSQRLNDRNPPKPFSSELNLEPLASSTMTHTQGGRTMLAHGGDARCFVSSGPAEVHDRTIEGTKTDRKGEVISKKLQHQHR